MQLSAGKVHILLDFLGSRISSYYTSRLDCPQFSPNFNPLFWYYVLHTLYLVLYHFYTSVLSIPLTFVYLYVSCINYSNKIQFGRRIPAHSIIYPQTCPLFIPSPCPSPARSPIYPDYQLFIHFHLCHPQIIPHGW